MSYKNRPYRARLAGHIASTLLTLGASAAASAAAPKMSIFHFDVNTGDATLIVSPDGRGVLIDGGDRGRGKNPIAEFLNRARADGVLTSLEFTIATHYDADHIGGLDEVYESGWYPEIAAYDRGDLMLPPFDRDYVETSCPELDPGVAQFVADWGSPTGFCPAGRRASCQIVEYFLAADEGGRRKTATSGLTLELDHGIEVTIFVANATNKDGDSVDVEFQGRRDDCAANDLSVGVLVSYGDFRYRVAGDLTGIPEEGVADVEGLIAGTLEPLDIYHVNHHGSNTSSSPAFMDAIHPTVAIVSNGTKFDHPLKAVIDDRVLSPDPPPAVYLTNRNPSDDAWNEDPDAIADDDHDGYDGMIEVSVWQQSFRVFRWRNGNPLNSGDRYEIKPR